MPTNFHLIIGAGATGSATARLLADDGISVRIVTRSGSGPDHPLIERVATDASNRLRLSELAAGAKVIYNCANPPYNKWTTDWPPLAEAILHAAETSGAVLVTLSNLYGYPKPSGPMSATDPLDPPSIKGRVRADMWTDALAVHTAGRVRVTEVRASDFIGPDLGATAHMGDRVVPRLLKGKSVSLLGNLDVPHSWTALHDVARTLVTAGSDDRAWGRAWHVPTAPPMTQRALVHKLCDVAGIEPVKVSTLSPFMLRAVGLFIPAVRELSEVLYQFDAPFVIDASETTEVFGLTATPLRDTLQSALASYGHQSESDLRVSS